jgi:hypothetical protein
VTSMSKIQELQKTVAVYYKDIERDPVIKHNWVESYLNVLYFNKRTNELDDAWDDIQALILYIDRTVYTNLSELPWWEYSVAFEWINSHIWIPKIFDLNLENARRIIGRWRDFYSYLSKTWCSGIELNAVEKAYEKVCGGDRLKLVTKIPYTGDEFWISTSKASSNQIVDFTMAEFWLVLTYLELGESWDKLEAELKGVPSIREKRKRIQELREKLELAGYTENPKDLVRWHINQTDVEDAIRWFYHKRISQQR